jgi:thiopeptide-type bacteriocin biosynthesis protein
MNLNLRFLPQIIVRTPLNSIHEDIDDLVFHEAIYLSSNDLYDELTKTNKLEIESNPSFKKIKLSLHKYKSRASYRCTPFGLMAGINTAFWSQKNNIKFDIIPKKQFYRKTRLDMNVLCEIVKKIENEVFIKPYLKFYPNTSIYLIGNNYRYVEYTYINNQRQYQINNIEWTPYLELILKASKKGLTQLQLAQLLVDNENNEEDANAYLNEVITTQILINQLEPALTGTEYFESILQQLTEIQSNHPSNGLKEILNALNKIEKQIHSIDESITNSIDIYKNTFNNLKNILPNLKETRLFQTDLFKNTLKDSIDKSIQQQLQNTINFLYKITPPDTNSNLNEFIEKFTAKYHEKEIPLLIALDEENGIGYPVKKNTGINDLVEDIPNYFINEKITPKNNSFEECLLKIITKSHENKQKTVRITESDFNDITNTAVIIPSSIAIMFSILNASTNKIKFINTSGSSAINLLARFANTNNEIKNIIKEIAEFEQTQIPNKILAEIIHLPENRIGNILSRPSTRTYEIPYLTRSSVEIERQIHVQDLTIRVQNNTIILFDTKLKKEIIPRLSNAHNYMKTSLPVYYFLCDLQSQYFTNTNLGFSWGNLSSEFDFFPRIEYDNTVLSSAKWIIKQKDLQPFNDSSSSTTDKTKAFIKLKNRIQLDEKFIFIDGGEELLIDSTNQTSMECFINMIKAKHEIVLEEYLFNDKHALITNNDEKPYTNECIALLLNEQKTHPHTYTNSLEKTCKKSFNTNTTEDGWLYYKIYSGPKTCDDVLTSKINEITSQLLINKSIDSWFFIRYNDPDSHLRFRIHLTEINKIDEIQSIIDNHFSPLINQHIISKIQTDKYEREIERYGANCIKPIEHLFYNDSEFVMNTIIALNEIYDDSYRWQIAIKSVDDLLNDFNYNIENKYLLISQLNSSFFKEHGASKDLKIRLDLKYRKLKQKIEVIFNWEENSDFSAINTILKQRSDLNKTIIKELILMQNNNVLQIPINELIPSILHMNLNRLFMGRNRTNELVIYDLLSRHYKSHLVRLKSSS